MTYRISLTGIDGAGKSTVRSDIANNLSKQYSVAQIGSSTSLIRDGKEEYLFQKTTGFLDMMRNAADRISFREGVLIVNGINMQVQQSLEKKLIKEYSPDISISGRDMTLCAAVYITYYVPSSRSISTELRLRIFNSLRRMGYPDQLFYMDVEPKTADLRIRERMEGESAGFAPEKAKFRQMHENPENLSELRKYYLEGVAILERHGVNVVRIPTTGRPHSEVTSEIQAKIEDRLSPPSKASNIPLRGANIYGTGSQFDGKNLTC